MRRFQTAGMATKPSKAYEALSRSSIYPGPGPFSRDRLIKYTAALIITIMALSGIHTYLTPPTSVYGLMIDAGSTGSRIHTYTFSKDASGKLDVQHEDFHAIKPGLSHYKGDPEAAADSLLPLLQRAKDVVPASMRARTPVVLRATAGLRMTGLEAAKEILSQVRATLRGSGFRFDEDSWAGILGGNEEGIYSWITVNYLLDRAADNTVGTLEMGGGSSQIAYVAREEGVKAGAGNCTPSNEEVEYKGRQLKLYTTSHLDFGLQKARALILKQFEEKALLADNPCMNSGKAVMVEMPFDESGRHVSLTGSGDYEKCKKVVDEVLTQPAMGTCACEVCTYHGAAQPHAIAEYIAIAFYRERTIAVGLGDSVTLRDIVAKGVEVCRLGVEEVMGKYPDIPNGVATDLCLDLAYIAVHLEKGHGIREGGGTKLMVLDKIRGFELGWCLGAMQQTMDKLGGGS